MSNLYVHVILLRCHEAKSHTPLKRGTQSYSWHRPPPSGTEKYPLFKLQTYILNLKNKLLLDGAKLRTPNDLKKKENIHTQRLTQSLFLFFFTFGLSSRICWRMSLCFSSSLSCLLLCASSNFQHRHAHRHTRTISGWYKHLQVEMNHIFLIKWHDTPYNKQEYRS